MTAGGSSREGLRGYNKKDALAPPVAVEQGNCPNIPIWGKDGFLASLFLNGRDYDKTSKKAKRILAHLNDRKYKNCLVGEITGIDQDPPARVGGDQQMRVLSDMNQMEDEYQQHIQDIGPRLTVY